MGWRYSSLMENLGDTSLTSLCVQTSWCEWDKHVTKIVMDLQARVFIKY
jgi:hypothetical protein